VITPSNGSVNQAAQDVAGVVDGCEPPDPEGRAELGHRVHRGRPAASVHQTLVPGRRTEHSALMTSSFATARSARPAGPPRTKDSEAPRREQDVVPVPRSAYLVGSADDPAEAAADALATRALTAVGQLPVQAAPIFRLPGRGSAPSIGRAGGPVSGVTGALLDRLRGSGSPLPQTVRNRMEHAFGTGFGDVRVHSGDRAAALNRDLGAVAFSVGRDVVLGSGTAGSVHPHVLAHELAHVVQDPAGDAHGLRRHSAAEGSTIRRLVGFEVELSIPTLARNAKTPLERVLGGSQPDPLIGAFFAGGQPDKCEMGAITTGLGHKIGLSSDHDTEMATRGESYFRALSARYPAAMKQATYSPLSNLEYGTPAIDELAPKSDAEFHQMATAIDDHAQNILTADPAHTMGGIDGAMFFMTGVPVTELDRWLSRAGNDQERDQTRARLQEHIRWMMYVQATVGVLPSGLIPLYRSQAQGIPDAETDSEALAAIKEAANAVATLSTQLRALPQLAALGMQSNNEIVVAGILTMAASHAIGRAMLQTNLVSGSDKNAVQLFNKFGSNALVTAAASTGVRKQFKDKSQDPETIKFVRAAAECIHKAPQTQAKHWRSAPYKAHGVSRPRLYGTKDMDATAATAYLLLDWLTGSATIELLRAGDPGNINRPDPVPQAIKGKAGGQQGVPLEMRWILEFPQGRGELWPIFQSVLAEVREANLVHLDGRTRAELIAATAEG